jgi:hypothetical protein
MDGISNGLDFTNNKTVLNSFDNVYGGQNIYDGNKQIAYTKPNIHGGTDVYANNQLQSTSMKNIHGGVDVYQKGQKVVSTAENIHGGQDVYKNSQLVASGSQSQFGLDYTSGGQSISHTTSTATGLQTVMNYSNPLAHPEAFAMVPFR